MYSKEQWFDAIAEEVRICQHLAAKLSPADLEHRLSLEGRSTLELLRYLTYSASAPIGAILGGGMEHIQAKQEAAEGLRAEDFAAQMDAQLSELRELLGNATEDDLQREVELPWGGREVLGAVLVNVGLKFLTAYRMQLFLHAKAAGHGELGSYNCWMGVDPPAES